MANRTRGAAFAASDDEGELPELARPNRFPEMGPPAHVADDIDEPERDPHGVREAQDREASYNSRMERAKRARLRRLADNPFLADGPMGSVLAVPEDDPEWSYKWVRYSLPADATNPAGVDVGNMTKHTGGMLEYEPVRFADLPDRWQARYRTLNRQLPSVQGIASDSGFIVSRDLLLMRTSRDMRDMQVEAWDEQARRMRQATNQQTRARMHSAGAPVKDFQDDEFQAEER